MNQIRLLQDFDPMTVTAHVWINGMMWFFFGNLTILAAALRHISIMKYLHSICFFITICFLYGLSIPWITPDLTFPEEPIQDHMRIGIFLIIASGIQLIGGIILLILRRAVSKNSYFMYYIRKGHLFLGYTTSFLAKASGLYMYYIQFFGTFLLLIFMEAVFISLLIYIKFFRKQMQQGIIHPFEEKRQKIRPIRSIGELSTHYRDYGIIGNFVYDLSPLKIQHPGGYQIIKSVREKDLDRYMYGMYRSEGLPLVPTNSHTTDSMQMLGTPIAKIQIQSPYLELSQETVNFELKFFRKVANSGIYVLSFFPKYFQTFQFKGYSDVNQLGRYRSVEVNGISRLYTAVNFLQQKNKNLMRLFFPQLHENEETVLYTARHTDTEMQVMQFKQLVESKIFSLPIMLKWYKDGKLTPKLLTLTAQDNVTISSYKGPGLQFGSIVPGKVIFIGGGTGCFPYYDLIDLLFKSSLVSMNHLKTAQIIRLNPILENYSFNKHQFLFIFAFDSLNDIHKIILQQLVHLTTKAKNVRCILRIKAAQNPVKGGIKYDKRPFEQILMGEIKAEFSKVFVCGPPRMNEKFHQLLSNIALGRNKWTIL